jgi:cation diffusion facilitator family transporter
MQGEPRSHRQNLQQIQQAAQTVRRVTFVGLLVNLALASIKFALGIAGQSQALLADALHSVSDMVTDVVVIVGAPLWSQPADEDHPYGHGRYETLATILIGVLLGAAGIGIAWRALASMGEAVQPGWIALIGAVLSLVVKEALYRWTIWSGRAVRSSALMANAWHHRADAFSSVPVALAVLGARIWPEWAFLDQVGAVLVALLILNATWHIVMPALNLLVDRGVSTTHRDQIGAIARSTTGVCAIHALRTRHIGSGFSVDLHVLVDPDISVRAGHDIARVVKERIIDQDDEVVDVLVHIEPFDDFHHQDLESKR